MTWIQVTVDGQLPDEDAEVLLSVPSSRYPVLTGHLHRGKWFYTSGTPVTFAVNAWMQLPEPYQTKDYGA